MRFGLVLPLNKNGKIVKNFLRSITLPLIELGVIDSIDSMEKVVEHYGILPFFSNEIIGLSIEEMSAPGMLFGGNHDNGCWEWKGPVLRRRTLAYGKFFHRKAGFVSLDLLPDFINYRRFAYTIKTGSIEDLLLDIIKGNDSLSSTELKSIIFATQEKTLWNKLPEVNVSSFHSPKRNSLESALQRLQMGGRVLISDFEYKRNKRGERYGWGIARYSTPELLYGEEINNLGNRTPIESFDYIIKRMKKISPLISKKSFEVLLK